MFGVDAFFPYIKLIALHDQPQTVVRRARPSICFPGELTPPSPRTFCAVLLPALAIPSGGSNRSAKSSAGGGKKSRSFFIYWNGASHRPRSLIPTSTCTRLPVAGVFESA